MAGDATTVIRGGRGVRKRLGNKNWRKIIADDKIRIVAKQGKNGGSKPIEVRFLGSVLARKSAKRSFLSRKIQMERTNGAHSDD